MSNESKETFNPELDLVLERIVEVPVELVWDAWTKPEQLIHWFTPAPWKTIDCRIDLKPGGEFYTVMESPEGNHFPNNGCFLEVVPLQRLVFTDSLLPGYRPSGNSFMTAFVTMERIGNATKYKAVAKHKDPETKKQHEDMGFMDGWGAALDQLVAFTKNLPK
ncbi:SRPBCC family protein [Leptospira sp. 2 VSF19]|uniref:SRPBCC family protein n=1 Tax=Leptospira soteropolitanensis TaxID=2950025 RepID=A0AAW5VEB6_9LEPT|nr:SRPBCC family protein [Leptospira soteropolitanensis]MCW7493635.1 SRPBCC family protein [Leptospira soteropolitanensis]MCW7501234.1 SRPBCC family protein [Leptospira soteropolitanensis]MCW7523580.1 SRPBCC family protein [Leptospira soteropolitanensis]MCW7527347.1 SRPBCC family protein [Leptospira soteropolitanensis]MCW7531204.1 SRPBCC family protein [Leptospira soteropolitanensis]